MDSQEFKNYLNRAGFGDSTVSVWREWAEELEEYDSSHGEKPEGSYKTAEWFLGEFVRQFEKVRERHGEKIAMQIMSLADQSACPFPWEVRLAAEHLASGGELGDISKMEMEGTLEDFTDEGWKPEMSL